MKSHTSQHHKTFSEEMLPHMDSLYNYAYRLTNERNTAEDLLRETYSKALQLNDTEKSKRSKIHHSLFRIMRSSYINSYQKQVLESEEPASNEIKQMEQQHKPKKSPAEFIRKVVDGKIQDDDINEALTSLPEELRSILILHDIEGWTYDELAEFFCLSLCAVRDRLHQARKSLALKIIEDGR